MSKKHTKSKIWKILIMIVCVVVCVLGVLAVPFILDWVYGSGIVGKFYDNSFPADSWFSFIGSYFPATIIGILTLYQAYIIQKKERQYKKLLARYRYTPNNHANIYRYDKDNNVIGHFSLNEVRQILVRSNRKGLLKEWESGYIIECDMYDVSDIEMKQVNVKKVEWEINEHEYEQQDSEKLACVVNRISHSRKQIVIFWLFDGTEKADKEIAKCMTNKFRCNVQYETSVITISVQIVDEVEETCDLKMRYCLQSLDDNYRMSSIEENYCGE